MKLRLSIAALALAAATASAAAPRGVPADAAKEISARAAERGVPATELLAVVGDAAGRGVPTDLVTAKVLEGLSKGVPPARIAAVARDLTHRLDRAQAALADAAKAGLTPPSDRRAALTDLGDALAAGISGPDLTALVAAAREAGHGRTDAVVSAALAQGELARRGVAPAETQPLGVAIARRGPPPAGEIPALFDAWRAEGGKDPRAFVGEASRRIEDGQQLDGMVDVFAESPDHIAKDNGKDNGEGMGLGKAKQNNGKGVGPPAVPPGKAKGHGKK